jgi:hypothetical protein
MSLRQWNGRVGGAIIDLSNGGQPMRTTILASLIFLAGLVTIATGAWILFILVNQEADIALEYYAMAIGMICGGLGLGGLAQALRLLLEIYRRPTLPQ